MERRAPVSLARMPQGGTVFSINLKLWQGLLGLVATLLAIFSALAKGIDTYVQYRVGEAVRAAQPQIVAGVAHDLDSLQRQLTAVRATRATDKEEMKTELAYIRDQIDEIKAILIEEGRRPR
jgi:hypothetical protein